MIKLYNTLSKTKEVFKPIKGKTVGFYTCGPTVYDCAHIGNFRTYIFEDVLRRVLEFNGYKVNHIENITDVDDKTIKRSIQKKMSLHNLTEKFTNIFFSDLKKVNIKPAVKFPRATKHIKQMVELIQKLLDKNIAYLSDDRSIYFSIKKFKNYGKFANLDLMGLKEGARVLADEYQKEQGSDFVLWKKWNKNDGDNFWKQEFAISDPSTSLPRAYSGQVGTSKRYAIKGRPGWHLECSAMSKKYLGQPFDIHAGAVDLIFPHHQNEIAQSEAAYGKKMVNYWIHGEHLLVDKKKMAKSAGNFYALADIIKKDYHPLALRYLCLESHYRSKMNFTWKALDAAQNTLNAIRQLGQRQKTSKHLNIKTLK
ncbi:cysteine--tRNA ligase, partial [Candidatus Berkelbacteria bacterium RIFCSPHIGHO2_12_FULL_36_9]